MAASSATGSNLGQLERLTSPDVESTNLRKEVLDGSHAQFNPEAQVDAPVLFAGVVVLVIMLGVSSERILNVMGPVRRVFQSIRDRNTFQEQIKIETTRQRLETSWTEDEAEDNIDDKDET